MTTHILRAKEYHIAQKMLQFFCVANTTLVFSCAIKTSFRAIYYSECIHSFLSNKNLLIPAAASRYIYLISQTWHCACFLLISIKDEIC